MEPLSGFLSYLKLPTKMLATVGAVAACVLFLPADWIDALGLSSIRKDYAGGLGIAVLLAGALLVIEAAAFIGGVESGSIRHRRQEAERVAAEDRAREQRRKVEAEQKEERQCHRRKERQAVVDFLQGMTDPERAVCLQFIERNARTAWLNLARGP